MLYITNIRVFELLAKVFFGNSDKVLSVIRGLLCTWCNLGLGKFNESLEILNNAINYLRKV